MSEDAGLCLRGKQVYPKPRPKDFNDKSTSKIVKNNGRPFSANESYKSLIGKQWEKTSRPKSASEIPLQEKSNLNRQSKLAGHCKASFRSKKSTKCAEGTLLNAPEGKIMKAFQSSTGIHVRNGIQEEDQFSNFQGVECRPPKNVGSSNCHRHVIGRVVENVSDEFEFNKVNLKKQLNGEDHSFDSLLEHFEYETEIVHNSPEVTKAVSRSPTLMKYEENTTPRHNKYSKHSMITENPEMLTEEREFAVNSAESQCIDRESVQKSENETVKVDTMENNLISLLVDIEEDMISTCDSKSQNGLKFSGRGKCPSPSLNHLPCLLESDFPTSNLEIENEIKMFQVLCDVSPSKEKKNGSFQDEGKGFEEAGSKTSSSGMSPDSLDKNIIEETSAEIASQIEKVDKILRVSREHLHEDILDIFSIHENNAKLINVREADESTKLISERPLSVEGSSQCSMKSNEATESQNRQTTAPYLDTSSSDDFFGDMFDSGAINTSYGMKSPCETSEVPIRPVASPPSADKIYDHFNEEDKSCAQSLVENSGYFKNDQSSDEDSTYGDIITTLKVLEKEEREPVLLSSRPPPTGSEFDHTPRAKLRELLSFLDDVDQSCSSSIKSVADCQPTPDNESFTMILPQEMKSSEPFENPDSSDSMSRSQIQEMRLQEQAKGLALLKQELEKTREKSARDKEKLRKKLEEEHAKIVMRHQEFIEKLLAEKKAITEKCEALILKLQRTEESHKATLLAMEEHHAIELRSEHERARLEIRATRDKWIREKTQKIQTATAKGAEGEVKRLVSEQAYQIEALWKARLDELRGRLEREAEEGMAKERELARKRLEERVEEMDRLHQEERRKFLAEECVLRTRAEEAERRVRDVEEEARKRRAEDLIAERARTQANLEKATYEFENKLQVAVSKERAQRELAAEAARKEEREQLEMEQRKKESKLKEQFRLERDRGIEKAVQHLTRQAEKTQHELEARTEMTIRRMRERCDEQVQNAEAEAEKERRQCADIRMQAAALLEENASLKSSVSRLEKELEAAHKLTTSLYEERNQIRELVVEEWSARVAALREEVGVLKAQVVGEKERREIELAQVRKEREHELIQVQKRVEIAIAKKEENINQLKSMYEAALKKCSQLKELLDKQRKDLLLK